MFYTTQEDLLNWIVELYYRNNYNKRRLRLELSLYLLFREYRRSTIQDTQGDFPEYLFNPRFTPHAYGFKDPQLEMSEVKPGDLTANFKKEEIETFLVELLDEIAEKSDFLLIDLVHEDKIWQIHQKENLENLNLSIVDEILADEVNLKEAE